MYIRHKWDITKAECGMVHIHTYEYGNKAFKMPITAFTINLSNHKV